MIWETVSARHPEASFCFFFGSRAFGRGDAASDVDVIVVLPRVANAYRETFSANGFLFDAHVHDPETLHFLMRMEQRNGLAMLAGEVDQARVLPQPCEVSSRLKEIARQLLDAGAPPPSSWTAPRRYFTSVSSDLERSADEDERRILAMELYPKLLETFLRSRGQLLDGQGRYLVRAVRKLDPAFFERARHAMAQCFGEGSVPPLLALTREVLDLIGGPLVDGYRQDFPPTFRLPLP